MINETPIPLTIFNLNLRSEILKPYKSKNRKVH